MKKVTEAINMLKSKHPNALFTVEYLEFLTELYVEYNQIEDELEV